MCRISEKKMDRPGDTFTFISFSELWGVVLMNLKFIFRVHTSSMLSFKSNLTCFVWFIFDLFCLVHFSNTNLHGKSGGVFYDWNIKAWTPIWVGPDGMRSPEAWNTGQHGIQSSSNFAHVHSEIKARPFPGNTESGLMIKSTVLSYSPSSCSL